MTKYIQFPEFKRIVLANFKSQRILLREIKSELVKRNNPSEETSVQVSHADREEQDVRLLGLPALDRKALEDFDIKLKNKEFKQQVVPPKFYAYFFFFSWLTLFAS